MLSTALQISFDYRREMRNIDQQIQLIHTSYIASLARSMWDFDQAQLELQLKGIKALPDIAHLELKIIRVKRLSGCQNKLLIATKM